MTTTLSNTPRPLTALEIHAREKVWRAAKNYERVELSRDEAEALWQSILNTERTVLSSADSPTQPEHPEQ